VAMKRLGPACKLCFLRVVSAHKILSFKLQPTSICFDFFFSQTCCDTAQSPQEGVAKILFDNFSCELVPPKGSFQAYVPNLHRTSSLGATLCVEMTVYL
jgi:hypothetical protein